MKNYSNFINGFISKYEIKDGNILIYTPLTKKNEPYIIKETKANLALIESRLEKQYKLIIKNQDEILKYNYKRKQKILGISSGICLIIAIALLFLFGSTILTTTINGLMIAGIYATKFKLDYSDETFKEEVKQYKRYMEHRQNIEQAAKEDENITKYLKESTISKIEENAKLKEQGTIDSVYNIDLMDKMSLQELKKLLTRYKLYTSLQEEQNFKVPQQNPIFKKRTLKPKNNQEDNK